MHARPHKYNAGRTRWRGQRTKRGSDQQKRRRMGGRTVPGHGWGQGMVAHSDRIAPQDHELHYGRGNGGGKFGHRRYPSDIATQRPLAAVSGTNHIFGRWRFLLAVVCRAISRRGTGRINLPQRHKAHRTCRMSRQHHLRPQQRQHREDRDAGTQGATEAFHCRPMLAQLSPHALTGINSLAAPRVTCC